MGKKTLHNIITALLAILIASTAVMIYFSNLKSVTFDQGLYEKEFQKHDVYANFEEDVGLEEETAILLTYLESGKGEIDSDFFNEKEKTHLVEVRQLFRLVSTALNIAVILSIISLFCLLVAVKHFSVHFTEKQNREYFKKLISNLLIGVGAVVDGIAVLFALMALFFSSAFTRFHLIFFRTDTWILDPATDNLIRMFPEPFFFDLFIRIILMSVVFATILLIIGFLIRLGKPKILRKH